MRFLFYVLEDQLDMHAPLLDELDPDRDAVLMAELDGEARRRPYHKQRLVLIWSAMRHACGALRARGLTVHYQRLDDAGAQPHHGALLKAHLAALQPERLVVTRPGDHRVLQEIKAAARTAHVPLDVQEDPHFLSTPADFAAWAEGRKRLTLEYFYREMRARHGVLMAGDAPEGGRWNYDQQNRERFGRDGPGLISAPLAFPPDETTRAVMALVAERFADHPGRLDGFAYPVTHAEARRAVEDFVAHRLPTFGTYQDAMWTERPYLHHSRLSAALNLHLIHPRYVIDQAEAAYHDGRAPLNAVEGFIRQILGWREFVRGVYWTHMPGYDARNALEATRDLPAFYWTGDTDMTCVRQVVHQLHETAYAHHIQRLMVTGLFALLYGARPQALNDWHMALYADAWEWASVPNVVGMSQYADGGLVATKPYAATGKYIQRMSNYCRHCAYDPGQATGPRACPFTTLYWDFLMRHEERLAGNRRMKFQVANLRRKSPTEREAIADRATWLRVTSGE